MLAAMPVNMLEFGSVAGVTVEKWPRRDRFWGRGRADEVGSRCSARRCGRRWGSEGGSGGGVSHEDSWATAPKLGEAESAGVGRGVAGRSGGGARPGHEQAEGASIREVLEIFLILKF
jgi:hypothetical protein